MNFQIEVGEIPGSISEFKRKANIGDPALVIRHPSGPWTISAYVNPLGGPS